MVITNQNGTGAFAEVLAIPRGSAAQIQARTASDIQLRVSGQTTYWTIKSGEVFSLKGNMPGDLLVNAPVGVVVEFIMG